MGVGLRFDPALTVENRVAAWLRCLTDKAERSGERPRESMEKSFTGVRRAGDDGGIEGEGEEGDKARKRWRDRVAMLAR